MKKKIFLNAFYNLALILCVIGAVKAYENNSPLISIFLGAAFAAFWMLCYNKAKDAITDFMSKSKDPK